MPIIKEYKIKGLGNFHIKFIEKDFEIIPEEVIKRGYYEAHGIGYVTDKHETIEEAEISLKKHLYAQFHKKSKEAAIEQNTRDVSQKQLDTTGLESFVVK